MYIVLDNARKISTVSIALDCDKNTGILYKYIILYRIRIHEFYTHIVRL